LSILDARSSTRVDVRQISLRGRARMPCLVVDSGVPGPRVVVAGNLHGDEVTGVIALQDLATWLPTAIRRGRVTIFPSLNPRGLERGSRTVPGDNDDPNRHFPGDAKGTPAEQHAHAVWKALEAEAPEFVIDLHADAVVAIPYALVDRVLHGRSDLFDRCTALATASGLTVVREYPLGQYHAFGLARSFTGAVTNGIGIPSVTLEIGPRRAIDPSAIDAAGYALRGMLGHVGVVDVTSKPHETCVAGGPWRRENGPRTTATGLVVPVVLPGVLLEAGAAIVEVRDVAGHVLDRVAMPVPGFVMSFPDQAWLASGVAAATLAVKDT
jgi:predicted deacylase